MYRNTSVECYLYLRRRKANKHLNKVDTVNKDNNGVIQAMDTQYS